MKRSDITGLVLIAVVLSAALIAPADQLRPSAITMNQIATDHVQVFETEQVFGAFWRIKEPPPHGVEPAYNHNQMVQAWAQMREFSKHGKYALR